MSIFFLNYFPFLFLSLKRLEGLYFRDSMQETSVDQNDEGLIRGYNKYSDLTDICMAEMQVVITIESIHERDFKSGEWEEEMVQN